MNQPQFLPRAGETHSDSSTDPALSLARLPSVDRILNNPPAQQAIASHGRAVVKRAAQQSLDAIRQQLAAGVKPLYARDLDCAFDTALTALTRSALQRVFNLTGTVIHTNLGRSPLPEAAVDALIQAARYPVTIEYDLAQGSRGERDHITEQLICELTGAEAATVVNNNAAAVLLALTALAGGKDVLVSRGELVEIGGSFRIPDIMQAAGCRLVEVGTTNRTHLADYENAISERSAMIARIHTSNFAVVGFTASPSEAALAELAHRHARLLMVDLGSGALLPFEQFGLPHEPLPQQALRDGADVVTFSGDKLLGGPQCGVIVGNSALIERLRRHPLKRVLRCDKLIVSAFEAVLRLYRRYQDTPQQLTEHLPVLRLLTRPPAQIRLVGERCLPALQQAFGAAATVTLMPALSQIGSGSLPVDRLDSWAAVITPAGKRSGRSVDAIETRLRALPIPVIGRIRDGAVWLDLRTLEDEAGFLHQLHCLAPATAST
ncbi:MAG: L-seryl-tRNA(Sec) selenium transferase [Pseudomonadota bacterium]|nr:L-seryl-tRNA(Sec) selenium transferase [Pseudomonadota bacterium]